jgi:hypothetical protein
MTSYIFFHNEWTDICFLEYETNKIKRTNIDEEYGTFIINENEIIIKWDNWDPQNIFVLIDNKYYLKDSFKKSKFIYDSFETYYIFNYDNKIIFKEDDDLTKILKGTYIFNNKLLLIKWNNTNIYKKYIFIESKNIYINQSFVNKILYGKNIIEDNNNNNVIIEDNNNNVIIEENNNVIIEENNNNNVIIEDNNVIIDIKQIIDIKEIENNILLNNINNYKLTTLNDVNIRYNIELLKNENYEKLDINKLNIENINYIDFDNIEKYKEELLFNKDKLYNDFYSINLPFKIPEKNNKTKTVITLSEWGYPAFGGGENWLIDMSKMLIEENYEAYLICFSDVFNNESFKETKYINFDKIHIIQMEKNIQNILKVIKLINPDIINHQGINRLYYMKIANILNIPFITGFCFWQNIIKMNRNNFNINMLNNKFEKCDDFDLIMKYSYPYASSRFVNDIIFDVHNTKLPFIESISHDNHYLDIADFNNETELKSRIFVTIINCHYNKGGHIIKYLCENIDYNIPLLFVYTEYDPQITVSYIEELLNVRNKHRNINLIICNKVNIKNIYKYSRIILIPSLCDETFCRIGYEAMNNKIPIISTMNGNLKYLLDGYSVFLPGDKKYYDLWKLNIENIYNNREILKKYSENNNDLNYNLNYKLNYNIVKNKVINFFDEKKENKYIFNEKNVCLIIPWADQGLGIQGREYYITLKELGYNPYVFSFKPYHSNESNKLLQCDKTEWDIFDNIYYSNSYRENINIEEIIDFIYKNNIQKVIIPEASFFNIFNITSVLKLLNIKTYLIVNIECVRLNEVCYHFLFDKIIANNLNSYKILHSLFHEKVELLGFHLNHNFIKNLPEGELYNGKRKLKFLCIGGLNSISRKNLNIIIDVFSTINNNFNNLLFEVNIHILGVEKINTEQYNLKNINIFYEKKSYKQILETYINNDIFIHLGTQEGLGLGFYESLYCGTPILTIDWIPNTELIHHNKNGWISSCLYSKNYENTISIINKGNIIKTEIYTTIIEIISNTQNTISIIKETYNNKLNLYNKNKEYFNHTFVKILS